VLQTLRNAWRIDEIRKKLLFLFFIVLIYRLGNAVTVPYIDTALLSAYFSSRGNTILGLLNTMSGSALERASIFALSIQPYINASIIIQLLTIAIPALERLQKEGGEEGKKTLEKVTRYSTVAIALLQGYGYYVLISTNGMLTQNVSTFWTPIVVIGTFMAGSTLLMWMGEQITEFGIGNGISVILFVSIVSRFPTQVYSLISNVIAKPSTWWIIVLMLIGALAIMVLIVIVTNAERRIPVQYSKRVVGRKMYGGQSTHLPMKVNMSGVLPIIFAQSIASIPATVAAFVPKWADSAFVKAFDTTSIVYMVIYFLLIVFFSYFYSTIQFNPIEIANNLKKNGGFIIGFRAGRPTAEFIQRSLTKITLFGAIYLAIIAITPLIISHFSPTAAASGISLGGTSIIIVISVALETIKQLESQMLMRHYKGFLE
jgi:preprotein translocase subunit SecY